MEPFPAFPFPVYSELRQRVFLLHPFSTPVWDSYYVKLLIKAAAKHVGDIEVTDPVVGDDDAFFEESLGVLVFTP